MIVSDQGFTKVDNWFLKHKGLLNAAEKMTFLALKSFTYEGNDTCHPSLKTIADMCGSKEDTTRKRIAKLEALGLIRIKHRSNKSNEYTIINGIPKVFMPRQEPGEDLGCCS